MQHYSEFLPFASIQNPSAVSICAARLPASLFRASYRPSSAACVCSSVGDSEAGSCDVLRSAGGIHYHSAGNSAWAPQQVPNMHCTCKVRSKYEYKIIIPNLDENVEGAKLQIT